MIEWRRQLIEACRRRLGGATTPETRRLTSFIADPLPHCRPSPAAASGREFLFAGNADSSHSTRGVERPVFEATSSTSRPAAVPAASEQVARKRRFAAAMGQKLRATDSAADC